MCIRDRLIAKIEKPEALDRLPQILAMVDGVMVARGDLGVEMPLEEVPVIQKRLISQARQAGKVVITATQMLRSMMESPRPTRAEATDVANAILDGADCIMLSEETAIGKYADKAVAFMRKIAQTAEEFHFESSPGPRPPGDQEHPARFLAYAAALLAQKTRSKAIVCHSTSGATARILSACWPKQPVYALSPDARVRHFTNLSWGVVPEAPVESEDSHQDRAEKFVCDSPAFAAGDCVVITAGQPKRNQIQTQTNVVKIFEK
jgi:pyruvate kinase